MNGLAKTVRIIGWVWITLASLVMAFAYAMILYRRGFGALQEMLNPFTFNISNLIVVVLNFIVVVLTFAPGAVLFQLAEAIRQRRWRGVLGMLVALPVALGIVVFMGVLVANRAREHSAGDNRTRDYKATAIRVKNQSATMNQHKNYFVTLKSGPVGKEGIPEVIKIGDKITVKERSLTVNHIFVTEVLEDMKWAGKLLAKKGDVRCTVVERLEDLPDVDESEWRNRLWLYVKDCEPLQSQAAPQKGRSLQLMTPAKWPDLTEQEHDIYTAGALETWSFVLYSNRAAAQAGELSDFVACVHKEKLQQFRNLLWLKGDLETPVAEHIFDRMTPIVCREYVGKGDKTEKPLYVLSKSDWMSFDAKRKAIYVTAYLETAHHYEGLRRAALGEKAEALDQWLQECLARVGIERVLAQVRADERKFEWQYPLPWSIALSLGRACKVDK